MNTGLVTASLPNISVALALGGYATYNFVNGGIHVKGQWKTKEEAPKSYYIGQGLVILLALAQFIVIATP